MPSQIVECPALGREVNKEYYCPGKVCNTCPDLRKNEGKKKRQGDSIYPEKPFEFAEDYLEGKVTYLPAFFGLDIKKDSLLYKDRFILDSVKKLQLDSDVENKIYLALYEFRDAIQVSKDLTLQKENRKTVKLRKDTIKYLEKASKYPYLTDETKKYLKTEIIRLKLFDMKTKTKYHPIRELSIESEVDRLLKSDDTSLSRRDEFLAKVDAIITESLNVPLKTGRGRPVKFFFKALQIVIYKLLSEESKISKEKAKKYAAEIINDHFDKFPIYVRMKPAKLKELINNLRKDISFCKLKSKDIDNALHSS